MRGGNPRDIHNMTAMNSHEPLGIQSCFEPGESFPHKVSSSAAMQLHIVVGGFNPVNRIYGNKVVSLAITYHQSLRPLAVISHQARQSLCSLGIIMGCKSFPRPLNTLV